VRVRPDARGLLKRFLAARFARGEYLGLHLTIGFLVSVAGLGLFGLIAEDVIHQEALTRLDLTVFHWLRVHATPASYGFWSVISAMGSGVALTVLAVGVGLLLLLRHRRFVLAGWVVAFVGAGLLDAALKLLIRRERPPGAVDFLTHISWSFPSGHALGSLVGYGMLTYLLVLAIRDPSLRIGVIVGAVLLILAVGISRLYLGVHYLSDVMGGYAAGTLWLSACISGLEVVRRWRARKPAAPAR
jgi:membrane-associated phospholipid phosphatase